MRRLAIPALALALAGCAEPTSTAAPPETSAVPASSSPTVPAIAGSTDPDLAVLVAVRSGGWCAEGACAHPRLQVQADGTYTVRTAGSKNIERGTLTAEQRAALEEALRTTTLEDDPKPAKSCASWVDGFDVEIRWRTADQPHRASSCDYTFAPGDPLLAFVGGLTRT